MAAAEHPCSQQVNHLILINNLIEMGWRPRLEELTWDEWMGLITMRFARQQADQEKREAEEWKRKNRL